MRKDVLMASVAAAFLAAANARADEGMWTFDNFPAEAVRTAYGITIDRHWLDTVRMASVRLNGCSASVVSENGLTLTNHHCIRSCAQSLSNERHNYIAEGFFADAETDERLCPGLTAEILERITDVTARVRKADAGKGDADFVKARDATITDIEREGCAEQAKRYRCQVIELYRGGQYMLYTFRYYKDVRLVAAPEEGVAFFGGDPDNFNFPRYDLDFSFVRLYENGHPVRTPQHLIWSVSAPKDGEVTFVAGNPGTTLRLLTADQLETMRDRSLPGLLIRLSELRGQLLRFSAESPDNARTAQNLLFSVENSFKALSGRQQALIETNVIADKRKNDEALKAKIAADPQLTRETGDPWADIAKALEVSDRMRDRYILTEGGPTGSILYGYAKTLVRAAQERTKEDGKRLPGYGKSYQSLLRKGLLDDRPVYPALEKLTLEFWLTKLREKLTADDADTKRFLGKDSPQTLAAKLVQSRLGDPALRKQLWDGGLKAVEASNDPLIRYVLATDPAARTVLNAYREKIDGPIGRAEEKIAGARFAAYGTSVYPDATFSLRLSYGRVAGWTENGRPVAPFTYYAGLWDRASGEPPYALPQRWKNAQNQVDGKLALDFVTNNDIIGGNSGSPVVNARGEVIGAAFDGNIHSLGGAFFFDGANNRMIGVTTAAITTALKNIYRQDRLVKELTP